MFTAEKTGTENKSKRQTVAPEWQRQTVASELWEQTVVLELQERTVGDSNQES